MKRIGIILFFMLLFTEGKTQYYFPPLTGNTWDTISPQSLGWCTNQLDSVYQMLDSKSTKAFIILKDGKIVVEKYFGTFTKDSVWFWASAGKTITSFLIGVAKQDGLLKLSDSTSKYLGAGWTSCPSDKESKITIRHQLTMTTGLNYLVSDLDCKTPSCLTYKADAGTQWYYHNAPYLLLQDVIAHASGMTYQQYTTSKLSTPTGITGLWVNGVYYSKPRSMARFGSLILNKGKWSNTVLLSDTNYYNEMVNTSQSLNESYGYLFWLNGKSSFKLPGSTFTFPGKVIPNAPNDLICGLGKYDQKLYIWPSQNMVIVRMGNDADTTSDVPIELDTLIWKGLNKVFCNLTPVEEIASNTNPFEVYPNPVNDVLRIENKGSNEVSGITVFDVNGSEHLCEFKYENNLLRMNTNSLQTGIYFIHIKLISGDIIHRKFYKY